MVLLIVGVVSFVGGTVVENLYEPVEAVRAYWAAHFGKPAGQ